MADGWPTVPLESVVRFQEGPGILAKDFHSNGVPLVRLAGLGGYRVTLNGCDYLDPALVARKWSHFKLNKGDIVISTSASFGRPAVVGDEAEGAVFYTGLIRFRSSSSCLDEGYLKTFLGSRVFMLQAEAQASGSVISHFGPSHLRRMEIPLPPMREQQNIARVHSAIDDKIDLNRRMNATLEAMARAIFKDWFVDFGPTRAKMEGRAPYLAPEIWSLFPDRLDEEGKPEGWISRPLSAFIELVGGGTPKTDKPEFWGGDIPWFSVVDAPTSSDVFVTKTEKTITQEGLASCSARLLPKGATIITARGTVGKLAVAGRPMTANQSCYGVLGHGSIPPQFVYFLLRDAILRLQANTHGSVFDTITRATFSSVSAIRPRDAVMISFGQLVKPLMDRIHANVEESRTLAATRDLLLPKLMSGELRVKGAEEMLEVTA